MFSLIHYPHENCQPLIKPMLAVAWRHFILGAVVLCTWNTCYAEPSERELQIKAAYLYHFIKFTTWPDTPPVFHYCVYQDAGFANLLRKMYSDKTVGEASIDVTNINEQIKPDDCHLIYFSQTVSVDFLQKISQYAILSVGTDNRFTESGGIIYLFEQDQKLRFYINNAAATDAGLKISSQLLKLSIEP